MKGRDSKQGSLQFDVGTDFVIDDDFVMILTHPQLEEQAKVPFMCGLVKKKDFIIR